MKTPLSPLAIIAAIAVAAVVPLKAQTFSLTTVDAPNNVGQHTSTAIVNGNPAIAYYDATNLDLKYVRATNPAGTAWGVPVTVDGAGDVGQFCSLTVVNGRPAISYHDVTNGDLHYIRANDPDGASWPASPVNVHSTGDTGHYTCLRVIGGNPAIAYYDLTQAQLEYVRASDPDGATWPGTQVVVDTTTSNDVGQYASMTVVNGNPAISYYNAQGKDLMYVRATDATGSAWGTGVTVDSGGGALGTGQYTSLAVVNGNPAISYHDGQNGDLHYIRATDASGTTWPLNTPVLVDGSSADSGHFTSLAVIGGVPAISYYDLTNGDLHYVTGNDASGTTWGTPVSVDTTGDVGQYASLGLLNGVAAISYYDVTNGNLKFAYVPTPEIAVEHPSGTDIPDGGTKDFGSAVLTTGNALSFIIWNKGSADLTGLSMSIDGADSARFAVTGTPTVPILPGGYSNFSIQFNPTSVGLKTAVVHIASNDIDENPFDITVTGTGIDPVISIEQPVGQERPDGSAVAAYFGPTSVGGNVSLDFTIKNTGVGDLTGLGITIDGSDPGMFNVTAAPVAPVTGPLGSTTFTVKYAPTAAGTHTASLHVTSNDFDKSPYDVALVGSTTAPDIAVYDTAWGGSEITNGQLAAIDYGTTPVGTPVSHTFAVYNVGGGVIQCGAITVPAGFTITSAPAQMPPGGGAGLVIQLAATAPGVYSGIVSIASNDGDENPFTFPITGTVTGGPLPITGALGDVVTSVDAPNAAGLGDGTKFDALMRGGYIAENGTLAFPATLKIGVGDTTVSNFMAYWKHDGVTLRRLARMGEAAPETGASPAVFNILPIVPGLNDAGQVTLLATVLQTGSSTPPTTADNDTGLWSELGDTGFQILMREGDTVPGLSGVQVDRFGSGCFATAKTGAGNGEAAFTILMRGASTDTALLRCSVVGTDTTAVGIVAREHASAPGTGETFGFLNSSYTDAVHMDALGNIVFGAILMPSYRTSIWYQPVTGGAPVKAMAAGDAAPGTTATFASLDLPSMGSAGTFAFRGVLNLDGDNVANDKNDGVWRGSVAGGFTNILRRGDSNTNRPGLFSTAYVALHPNVKAGNIYGGWLTNANRGAWLGWIDLGGDGINAYPTDSFGVYTDTSGTMTLIAASADTAPGIAGAQFYFIDHPVCGGQQQVAFIATVTGGGTALGVNDKGIWRTASNGGPLSLVIRTGDSMKTTQGVKVIADVDMPGSGDYGNHIWETPVIDATGKMIVVVTFTDGSTSEVLMP